MSEIFLAVAAIAGIGTVVGAVAKQIGIAIPSGLVFLISLAIYAAS